MIEKLLRAACKNSQKRNWPFWHGEYANKDVHSGHFLYGNNCKTCFYLKRKGDLCISVFNFNSNIWPYLVKLQQWWLISDLFWLIWEKGPHLVLQVSYEYKKARGAGGRLTNYLGLHKWDKNLESLKRFKNKQVFHFFTNKLGFYN